MCVCARAHPQKHMHTDGKRNIEDRGTEQRGRGAEGLKKRAEEVESGEGKLQRVGNEKEKGWREER